MSELCIQNLARDHAATSKMLVNVESLVHSLLSDTGWSVESVQRYGEVVRFFETDFVLHKNKEDDLFFPALEGYLPVEVGPLAGLKNEHQELWAAFVGMRGAGNRLCDLQWDRETAVRFRHYALLLLDAVRTHMNNEETLLFPLASRYLSAAEDQRLCDQLDYLDQNRQGD